MWMLLSTTWRRVSLTLKQLRKEAVHSFFEIINWSWSSLCRLCAPCFRVPILCTEQHSTPSGLHLFDKRQVRHMWGQEKPNCTHLARFMRFLLSFFPTGPQTNRITSLWISMYMYIYIYALFILMSSNHSVLSCIFYSPSTESLTFLSFGALVAAWRTPRILLQFAFHEFHAFALLLFFEGPLFFSVKVFLGFAAWRMQEGNEQKGEREGWWCKCRKLWEKISRQASSLPYPVLPVDDPPPFWQMLVALRLEDSKLDWKTWLFFEPFDLLFWIFLLFSYLASILTIVPHSSFGPALQSDPSNVQLHLLRDMELCFSTTFGDFTHTLWKSMHLISRLWSSNKSLALLKKIWKNQHETLRLRAKKAHCHSCRWGPRANDSKLSRLWINIWLSKVQTAWDSEMSQSQFNIIKHPSQRPQKNN